MANEARRIAANIAVCATFAPRGSGQETTMRNPVLGIAIAFALAVMPCAALAEDKGRQGTFEVNDCGLGATNPVNPSTSGSGSGATTKPIKISQYATGRRQNSKRSSSGGGNPTTGKPLTTGSGQVASPTMQKKHIGQPKYDDVTTAKPAVQGNVLQKGTVGGSTGPTKPIIIPRDAASGLPTGKRQ